MRAVISYLVTYMRMVYVMCSGAWPMSGCGYG